MSDPAPGNPWIAAGAVAGFLAVALGAFGAHALSGRLSESALTIYRLGAQYQMYHALALIGLGLWSNIQHQPTNAAGGCFVAGIFIFSGSLYALALTDIKVLGAITPLGGISLMAGWILFAFRAWSG
jgi:uncharacterized membrane protein YgdD (TMEM256/DUF423 family)